MRFRLRWLDSFASFIEHCLPEPGSSRYKLCSIRPSTLQVMERHDTARNNLVDTLGCLNEATTRCSGALYFGGRDGSGGKHLKLRRH